MKSPSPSDHLRPSDLGAGPTAGPQPRDMEIAASLRITLNRIVKIMRRETRNDGQLSLTERSTLGLLYPDVQLAPTDIARTEKVTTQSMSQVVNHLVELKFVVRTPSAEDGRKILLSLSDAGRARVEQARQEKQEWLAKALHEKMSGAEKDLLVDALLILTKLVDE
jgi:DNA-binding MarR family transcriptional regulator